MTTNKKQNTYYSRYMRQARIFEIIGLILLFSSILFNELSLSKYSAIVVILAAMGSLFLIFGGGSSQPNVVIRSFANLLINDPSEENANEFLIAINATQKAKLSQRHIDFVYLALSKYENSASANSELTGQLKAAISSHIEKKKF